MPEDSQWCLYKLFKSLLFFLDDISIKYSIICKRKLLQKCSLGELQPCPLSYLLTSKALVSSNFKFLQVEVRKICLDPEGWWSGLGPTPWSMGSHTEEVAERPLLHHSSSVTWWSAVRCPLESSPFQYCRPWGRFRLFPPFCPESQQPALAT